MAYTTIDKSSLHFNTKLYSGNNSTNAITGVGFQPDLVWLKPRDSADHHRLVDSVRGLYQLSSNQNNAQSSAGSNFASFDTDGFTLGGSDSGWNGSSNTYVSWNWKAGTTGSGSTTGSGTSKTYNYSVNTTAGFSIIKYTGNGTGGHTIPHHLGVTPEFIIVKNLDSTIDWRTYHKDVPNANTRAIRLNSSDYWNTDSSWWNNTSPSSSVFTVGSSTAMNGDGTSYIAYCFVSKVGYQKIGTYAGNGSSSSPPFIYTGFKPSFIIMRKRDASDHWYIVDNKRIGYNPDNHGLYPNLTNVEYSGTAYDVDIYSNGFSPVTTDGMLNGDGDPYIYYAVGQSIVGSNNQPNTAR